MKNLLIFLLFLIFSMNLIISQELKEMQVKPVPESESEGYLVRNPNQAILIIHSTIPDLKFVSNHGIIGVDNTGSGEYWVHLKPGTHIIRIKAEGYSNFRDRYHIKKTNYKEIRVTSKKQNVIITEETQDINFKLNVSDAIPIIDGMKGAPQSDKTLTIPLSKGEHTIQFIASGYKPSDTKKIKVIIGQEETRSFDLERDYTINERNIPEIPYESVPFYSELPSVKLYIDKIDRGYINQKTGINVLLSASEKGVIHDITCKKSKYHTKNFTITVYKNKANPPVNIKLEPNFGTLIISCQQGDSKIYIDGKLRRKRANIQGQEFSKFKSGTYKIKVEKDRYFPSREKTITVKDGRTERVDFNLNPRWGNLTLKSDPSGAKVYLDNELIGTTPLNLKGESKGLLEGKYIFKLEMDSPLYESIEKEIEIKAGELKSEKLIFKDISGRIQVDVSPTPIKVFVNGSFNKELSEGKIKKFPTGNYELKISKSGDHSDSYYPIIKNVVLKRGTTEKIKDEFNTKKGLIFIHSNIPETRFKIIDLESGKTIFNKKHNPEKQVLTGKYKIIADATDKGYIPQKRNINITESYDKPIEFEFNEKHKKIFIEKQKRKEINSRINRLEKRHPNLFKNPDKKYYNEYSGEYKYFTHGGATIGNMVGLQFFMSYGALADFEKYYNSHNLWDYYNEFYKIVNGIAIFTETAHATLLLYYGLRHNKLGSLGSKEFRNVYLSGIVLGIFWDIEGMIAYNIRNKAIKEYNTLIKRKNSISFNKEIQKHLDRIHFSYDPFLNNITFAYEIKF